MDIRTVAVIGAGTMGAGIAQICAQVGWKTHLYDAFPEGLERGMESIHAFWDKGITRGKTTETQKSEWSANIHPTDSLKEAVSQADLVIEAVPEIMKLKREIFQQIDAIAPAHAILGSNTSGLPISDIAEVTTRPQNVIGMHFFNPVPLMALLELIRHDGTSDETIETAQNIAKHLGKTSILVRDIPGFATSRLGVVLGNEAIRMLADGVASANDIDTAMRLGYRHPMGPLELADFIGLDTCLAIMNVLHEGLEDTKYRPCPLMTKYVEAGWLGRKTKRGFYDYTGGQPIPSR